MTLPPLVISTKMAAVTKPQEMVKKPKDLKSFTSESFTPAPSLGPGRVIGPLALGNRQMINGARWLTCTLNPFFSSQSTS